MPNERNQLTRQAASPDTITDPAADWVASNWTLKAGQWGFESDTGQVKLGDGVTAWNDLAYFGGAGATRLFHMVYDSDPTAASYASLPLKVTSGIVATDPAVWAPDSGKLLTWEQSDLLVPDSNTAGLKVENVIDSLGPGELTVRHWTRWVAETAADFAGVSVDIDIANADYGPIGQGYYNANNKIIIDQDAGGGTYQYTVRPESLTHTFGIYEDWVGDLGIGIYPAGVARFLGGNKNAAIRFFTLDIIYRPF